MSDGRILYVDIDGTIRHGKTELGKFVAKPDDVVLFDGVKERLWRYKHAGWRVVGITNQGGVALGLLSKGDMIDNLYRTDDLAGGAFNALYACHHFPGEGRHECFCRKPRIGNLVLAAHYLSKETGDDYWPELSLFVGDRAEDEECARNAGIPFMWAPEWRERGEP